MELPRAGAPGWSSEVSWLPKGSPAPTVEPSPPPHIHSPSSLSELRPGAQGERITLLWPGNPKTQEPSEVPALPYLSTLDNSSTGKAEVEGRS